MCLKSYKCDGACGCCRRRRPPCMLSLLRRNKAFCRGGGGVCSASSSSGTTPFKFTEIYTDIEPFGLYSISISSWTRTSAAGARSQPEIYIHMDIMGCGLTVKGLSVCQQRGETPEVLRAILFRLLDYFHIILLYILTSLHLSETCIIYFIYLFLLQGMHKQMKYI